MIYRIPPVNLEGRGCLKELSEEIKVLGCKNALIVSDKFLSQNGTVAKVESLLDDAGIGHTLYNDVKQNPSVANVEGGLKGATSLSPLAAARRRIAAKRWRYWPPTAAK